MITQDDIQNLVSSARFAGFEVNSEDLELQTLTAGATTHLPGALPPNKCAVYIFKHNEVYLKVGKANKKTKSRFHYQHYKPRSSKSNLSKSLEKNPEYALLIGNEPGTWLKANTHRFNILIPSSLGKQFVHFAEAFFILKCKPKFENIRV